MNFIKLRTLLIFSFPVLTLSAQEVISFDMPVSSKNDMRDFGQITIDKPYGKDIDYTIRFTTLQKPKFRDTQNRSTAFLINKDKSNTSTQNAPYANILYDLEKDNTASNPYLEIKIIIPSENFSSQEQNYQLRYLGVSSNNKSIAANLDITIRYEQPEFLSLAHWEQEYNRNLNIASVKHQDDHLVVHANRQWDRNLKMFKIKLLAHERLVYQNPKKSLVPSFGLLNLPVKVRLQAREYDGKHNVQWNNFAAHFGIAQLERHSHFANGHYIHKLFGIGLFIHPSRQEVRYIQSNIISNNITQFITVDEPFQASFLGAGLSLYYAYNGFSFHFIPLAMDFQMNKRSNNHSIQNGVLYFSFGMGYTPKKWL